MTDTFSLIPASMDAHLDAITEILNEAIAHSTALYDYAPRSRARMETWFQTKMDAGQPVIGAVNSTGRLIGFASYGSFRAFPAFKYTVEHSLYVHRDHQGQGVGRRLLEAIVNTAEARGMHALVGAIDAGNSPSITLHESLGFVRVGMMPQVGFKFGRWLDLALYQRTLEGPAAPVDG